MFRIKSVNLASFAISESICYVNVCIIYLCSFISAPCAIAIPHIMNSSRNDQCGTYLVTQEHAEHSHVHDHVHVHDQCKTNCDTSAVHSFLGPYNIVVNKEQVWWKRNILRKSP